MPAIVQTYSDFDNINNNLLGAENDYGFLNSPSLPIPSFTKALSKKFSIKSLQDQYAPEKPDLTDRGLLATEGPTPGVFIDVKIPGYLDLEAFKEQKMDRVGTQISFAPEGFKSIAKVIPVEHQQTQGGFEVVVFDLQKLTF